MPTDPALYIVVASVIGLLIGFFAASVMASRKLSRLEKDSWAAASAYYERQADPSARRL